MSHAISTTAYLQHLQQQQQKVRFLYKFLFSIHVALLREEKFN